MNPLRATLGRLAVALASILCAVAAAGDLPERLEVVLGNTRPLEFPRGARLPLYVLPITSTLRGTEDAATERVLRELDSRGIGYTVDWSPGGREETLAEGLRVGAIQRRLGLRVAVNATSCLYGFFDGEARTLHVDREGRTFADTSFPGGRIGCPFALEHRVAPIREQVEYFLRGYREAGLAVDFVFADWEIDGPIEWNDAWAASRRCTRCRERIGAIDDFRTFQAALRRIRSELQRAAFGDLVTSYFPRALVGNYGVYPHDGWRYWYDYFERPPGPDVPHRRDGRAIYREWFDEFGLTGYTFAMPVVYTWYPTYLWYDFEPADYRWFYNMLLVGSNAGRHTPATVPIITFVHWTTTAPPSEPDPRVEQFSAEKYRELLWHLLLRGHDGLFLWCVTSELATEIALVHEVWSASLEHREMLERGEPIVFDVPTAPGPVVSAVRLGRRVLVRRTDFDDRREPARIVVDGVEIEVPRADGKCQEIELPAAPRPTARHDGLLQRDGRAIFPIGFYERPESDEALRAMAEAGVNLVRCDDRESLDRAAGAGLLGWVSLPVHAGATDALRERVESIRDHPALAVWEGPDEIVWTFTAYSGLARTAGYTRDDWKAQTERAVAYARREAARIIPRIRAGVELVKELDTRDRPFWINEAADSDVEYVRGYVDSIDITGCDYYPVRPRPGPHIIEGIGQLVERWSAIGRGRPVWMVLQGFSWHVARPDRKPARYPTFAESRFMAYDAIARGARGVLYWGSNMIDLPEFRESLYALTSELAALQPFLVAPAQPGVRAELIDDLFDEPGRGVAVTARRHGDDWLVVLVNEDAHRRLGVDVTGLGALEGRRLELLHGDEPLVASRTGFVTRLQAYETKLFVTAPASRWETTRTAGRDFGAAPSASDR